MITEAPEPDKARHLIKLPAKKFNRFPGELVGGLIFVMDKHLGIEEGMIGISAADKSYRAFIKEQVNYLKDGHHANSELQERFNIKKDSISPSLSEDEMVEELLKDNIFSQCKDKVRNTKLGTNVEGIGMAGILFEEYKLKCGITKEDSCNKQIEKLISAGSTVYMVKQDGQLEKGKNGWGTGPSIKRLMSTTNGQKISNSFLPARLKNYIFKRWHQHYLDNNTPTSVNTDAILETIATKIASARGFISQEIDTIEGEYDTGDPKIATIVTWTQGVKDLRGKLGGIKGNNDGFISKCDDNGNLIKIDKNKNIYRSKKEDNNIIYEKISKDGTITKLSKKQYNKAIKKAFAISDENVRGLGENLLSFFNLGDRDGIGKKGQNKMIIPIEGQVDSYGNQLYQLYGIDFGKAYKDDNPIINSVQDDFSFLQPTRNWLSPFQDYLYSNYSILYDNPLREKMKGLYLLAANRGKLTDLQKTMIAKEFEALGDVAFAAKLRAYPQHGINQDLNLIQIEIDKYRQLAADAKKAKNPKKSSEFSQYANKLQKVYETAKANDDRLLAVFSQRLNRTPKEIDILDNIEKLTATKISGLSKNGKVQLNHIRIERADRVAWQIEGTQPNGPFALVCQEKDKTKLKKIKERLLKHPSLQGLASKFENGRIVGITKEKLEQLHSSLTEDSVAQVRGLTNYRSQADRDQFHARLKAAQPPQAIPVGPSLSQSPVSVKQKSSVSPPVPASPFPRPASLTPSFSHKSSQQFSDSHEPIGIQSGNTFNALREFLKLPENLPKCHIKSHAPYPVGLKPEGIQLTFSEPKTSQKIEIVVEESIKTQSLQYSAPKELSDADFVFAAKQTFRLAMEISTNPDDTFDISIAPAEKQEALKSAYESAKKEFQATNSERPRPVPQLVLEGQRPKTTIRATQSS